MKTSALEASRSAQIQTDTDVANASGRSDLSTCHPATALPQVTKLPSCHLTFHSRRSPLLGSLSHTTLTRRRASRLPPCISYAHYSSQLYTHGHPRVYVCTAARKVRERIAPRATSADEDPPARRVRSGSRLVQGKEMPTGLSKKRLPHLGHIAPFQAPGTFRSNSITRVLIGLLSCFCRPMGVAPLR